MAKEDFDLLTPGLEKLSQLSRDRLVVGVPWSDQHLNMIGIVQEFGTTIKPKNSQYLVIPTKNAKGKRPKDIPGLFKAGHVLAVNDKSQPYGMRIMFILKESVVIPKRPFLRFTEDHNLDKWTELAADLAFNVLLRKINPEEFYSRLGEVIVNDIKNTIKKFDNPHNAPLTIDNKGFDDPLIQTGKLRDSITWIRERR